MQSKYYRVVVHVVRDAWFVTSGPITNTVNQFGGATVAHVILSAGANILSN